MAQRPRTPDSTPRGRHQQPSAAQSGASGSQGERGLAVGAKAPAIPLQGTNVQAVSLDQMPGSKVVVYFYETAG